MSWISDKKRIIHRVIILDRSGSMESCKVQTIAGFNEIVQTLRELERENSDQQYIVTLVLFNHEIKTLLYARPVKDLAPLTLESYIPLGSTALNDAIGLTMTRVHGEGAEELSDKNNTVVVTIFTDGYENASTTEFKDMAQVGNLIDRLQKTEQFTFTYVGANQDAKSVAAHYKIPVSNALNYTADASGTQKAFVQLNASTRSYSRRMSKGIKGLALTDNFFDESNEVQNP